jgi:hypothetical protein
MKLSQKLLGLAGLAMADYACCPYDDYGMPDPLCAAVLREKTPFEGSSRWMDNECKAWESNVDATFEGNTIGGCAPDNWGSCGFQRHFPWRTLTASSAEETALSLTGLASLDIDTTSGFVAAYATSGGTAAIADYNLGGLPFLGGICKLFIPVPSNKIVQVQVAGVHKPGNNYAQFPARATVGATTLDGTAYCFSVANVAESRDNTNGINNGNVAGEGRATAPDGRLDLFAGLNSIQRQAGVAFGVAFGDSLAAQTDVATGDELGEVKAGGNFDVVAHFADDWCEGRWTATDMQMTGDEGAGVVDYNNQQQNAGFSHDHKDIMDKRHNAAGYGTLYATSNTDYLARSSSVTYNSVTHGAVDNVRWPNSGAWAGFYSFVMCVKSGSTPAGMMANVWNGQTRDTAMSVSASDYRINEATTCSDKFANFRFNVRQGGSDIELCGPGQLPDGDDKRCTWNWNYDADASFGSSNNQDPEGFFDRSEQMNIDSWVRKRRGALDRTAGANNVAAVLKKAVLTFQFRDQDGTALLAAAQTLTSDVDATLMSIAVANTNGFAATMTCTNALAATAQRDNFPVCFTGDEIHFNLAYSPSSNTDNRAAVSPWFSTVSSDFSQVAP